MNVIWKKKLCFRMQLLFSLSTIRPNELAIHFPDCNMDGFQV